MAEGMLKCCVACTVTPEVAEIAEASFEFLQCHWAEPHHSREVEEREEEVEESQDPDLDDYDPRKPEFITEVTEEEAERQSAEILRRQISKLESSLQRRRSRLSPKGGPELPEQVSGHYETVLDEMRHHAKVYGSDLGRSRNRSFHTFQDDSDHPSRAFGHRRVRTEPLDFEPCGAPIPEDGASSPSSPSAIIAPAASVGAEADVDASLEEKQEKEQEKLKVLLSPVAACAKPVSHGEEILKLAKPSPDQEDDDDEFGPFQSEPASEPEPDCIPEVPEEDAVVQAIANFRNPTAQALSAPAPPRASPASPALSPALTAARSSMAQELETAKAADGWEEQFESMVEEQSRKFNAAARHLTNGVVSALSDLLAFSPSSTTRSDGDSASISSRSALPHMRHLEFNNNVQSEVFEYGPL